MSVDNANSNLPAIDTLMGWREKIIEPAAKMLRVELSPRSVMTSVPTVLLLGNHSSGKSSLINHLLGEPLQRTGVAPTDDSFTILMYGDEDRRIDGQTLVGSSQLPYKELEQFGPQFLQHIEGRTLKRDVLQKVTIIDSPGMIDSANRSLERPYNYIEVVKWLAERCDLVFLLFDPDKPGTTGETLNVLSKAISEIDCNLRIIMNKMDLFDNLRDFSRTYGALCWNLSRSLKTKDLPYVYTTVIPELVTPRENSLPLDDFVQALNELKQYITELPKYRSDFVINHTLEETTDLYIRARLLSHVNKSVKKRKWLGYSIVWTLVALLGYYAFTLFGSADMMTALFFAAIAVVVFVLGSWIVNKLAGFFKRYYANDLESIFRKLFRIEIAERDNEDHLLACFYRVKPKIMRTLRLLDLSDIKVLSSSQTSLLQRLIEKDIPKLRQDI